MPNVSSALQVSTFKKFIDKWIDYKELQGSELGVELNLLLTVRHTQSVTL